MPVVNRFEGDRLEHDVGRLEMEWSQVRGKSWYVAAEDVLLASAFSSYESKGSGSSFGVGGSLLSGEPNVGFSVNDGNGFGRKGLLAKVELSGELVMEVRGSLGFDGASVIAEDIRLNVSKF